jgi:hypothetical protein
MKNNSTDVQTINNNLTDFSNINDALYCIPLPDNDFEIIKIGSAFKNMGGNIADFVRWCDNDSVDWESKWSTFSKKSSENVINTLMNAAKINIESMNLISSEHYDYELSEKLREKTFKFKLLRDDDIENFPDMEWIVRGIIPKKSIGAFYGASGSGKSFLAFDMALAVTGGKSDWFGNKVKKVPVVYLFLEGNAALKKRIGAWKKHNNVEKMPENFFPMAQNFNLTDDNDVGEICAAINHANANGGLVIIDTLHASTCGKIDENSADGMGLVLAKARIIKERTDSTIMFIHHSGKDITRGMRGHNSLNGAMDFVVLVGREGKNRWWCLDKSRDELDDVEHDFQLNIIEIKKDSDGIWISSCVVSTVIDHVKSLVVSDLPNIKQIVMNEIDSELILSTNINKPGCPKNVKCIDLQQFMLKYTLIDKKENPNRARDWKRAVENLIKEEWIFIAQNNDWIWKLKSS